MNKERRIDVHEDIGWLAGGIKNDVAVVDDAPCNNWQEASTMHC